MLLSGWFLRRFGAKRMLICADAVSWVVPYLLLATAHGGLQAGTALVLMSLNAFASTPYLCLLAEGAPAGTRTKAFAFLNLCNILPGALLPWVAADLAETHAFLPTIRTLFLIQSACMGVGILWRSRILRDLEPGDLARSELPSLRQTLPLLLRSRPFRILWPLLLLQAALQSVWNAWSAVFLTTTLSLPDRAPGWTAQASAIAFTVAALAVLPRIPERWVPALAGGAFLVTFASAFAWLLPLTLGGALAVGAVQGLCGGIHASALSSLLPASLPERSRDHGFAWAFVGVHLGVAGFMALAGRFLHEDPARFPTLFVGLACAQAVAGLGLFGWWRRARAV